MSGRLPKEAALGQGGAAPAADRFDAKIIAKTSRQDRFEPLVKRGGLEPARSTGYDTTPAFVPAPVQPPPLPIFPPAPQQPQSQPQPVLGPSGRPLITAASLRQPDATGERLPLLGSSTLSYKDYENPIPYIVDELKKIGVDTSSLNFELHDDVVQNVGGNYVNRLIRVDAGGGRKEDYSVELALRSPWVTATEIQNLMKGRPRPS